MGTIDGAEDIAKRTAVEAIILSEIPLFRGLLSIESHGFSAWAHSYRIDVENEGRTESYFMKSDFACDCVDYRRKWKVSVGDHGREALKGEFESTYAIHKVIGDTTPKPMGWGSFKRLPGAHYYFCQFYELLEELPDANEFCKKVANLHAQRESPNGKFGLHVVTYNAICHNRMDIPVLGKSFS
ncbi:hypothetical protein BBP40_003417 [Aspergillus hancockii]|nr:hypothetical protein BBP40_003417 [Aspergillus hancockii]